MVEKLVEGENEFVQEGRGRTEMQPCLSPRAASPLKRRHMSKQAWGTY